MKVKDLIYFYNQKSSSIQKNENAPSGTKEKYDINSFIMKIVKTKNITYCYTRYGQHNREDLIINQKKPTAAQTLCINKSNFLGEGMYGRAYKINNYVVKIPHDNEATDTDYSNYPRCARVLNEVNKDKDFSRAIELNNGKQVLVTKYIDGISVTGKEAYSFVKK